MASRQLTVQEQRQQETSALRQTLDKMGSQIKMALPAHISVEKFQRVAITAVQTNPDLLTCDRTSLFGALMKCAQDGLLPDGRDAAIAIFKGQAQYMPMVAGLMKKARQSGEISSWSAHAVHQNDEFEYVLGDEERVVHKPTMGEQGPVIAAYSIVKLKDGTITRDVMTRVDIEKRRNVSRQKDSLQWTTFYEEGAVKTVIKHHTKHLPASTDLEKLSAALDRDDMMTVEHSAAVVMIGNDREEAPARVSRLDTLEHSISDTTPAEPAEGPADEQRVEAQTTKDALADILSHLARKVTIIDVNSLVSARAGELGEDDRATLAEAQIRRIAELKGQAE